MIEALAPYGGVLAATVAVYAWRRARTTNRSMQSLHRSIEDGLTQPASLHPVIDAALCLGCGTCIDACPERNVLGLLHGKVELVAPTNCIGHGACKDAGPQSAITLGLGTAERGVDHPVLQPNFEPSERGIFVAGELGGMGLIRNGIEQGRQAMLAIAERLRELPETEEPLDVVIIGAGPAGFSASLAAQELGLRCATLEQETLGGTVAHYPRGKLVMTAPVELPLYGKVELHETSKEELLDLWERVAESTGVQIRYSEHVETIERTGSHAFEVCTAQARYRTRCVLLAIGRRGTPRKLGVAGEDLSKVVYRLIDAAQYEGRHVLVVGGGDSALEAALSLADAGCASVRLSYRQGAFGRARRANRDRIEAAQRSDAIEVVLESTVRSIERDKVTLCVGDTQRSFANDHVIVCTGGILPTAFLESVGIEVETRHGES